MFGSAMMMRSGDGKDIGNLVDEVVDYSVYGSRMRVNKTYIAIYSSELVGVVARETMRRKNHENWKKIGDAGRKCVHERNFVSVIIPVFTPPTSSFHR